MSSPSKQQEVISGTAQDKKSDLPVANPLYSFVSGDLDGKKVVGVDREAKSNVEEKRSRSVSSDSISESYSQEVGKGPKHNQDNRNYPEENRIEKQSRFVQNNFSQQQKQQNQNIDEAYFKTKICPLFLKNSCRKGSGCNFAHGQKQLRGIPNFYKTRLCIAFKKGECQKPSSECRYAHGEAQLKRLTYYRRQEVLNNPEFFARREELEGQHLGISRRERRDGRQHRQMRQRLRTGREDRDSRQRQDRSRTREKDRDRGKDRWDRDGRDDRRDRFPDRDRQRYYEERDRDRDRRGDRKEKDRDRERERERSRDKDSHHRRRHHDDRHDRYHDSREIDRHKDLSGYQYMQNYNNAYMISHMAPSIPSRPESYPSTHSTSFPSMMNPPPAGYAPSLYGMPYDNAYGYAPHPSTYPGYGSSVFQI